MSDYYNAQWTNLKLPVRKEAVITVDGEDFDINTVTGYCEIEGEFFPTQDLEIIKSSISSNFICSYSIKEIKNGMYDVGGIKFKEIDTYSDKYEKARASIRYKEIVNDFHKYRKAIARFEKLKAFI